MKFFDDKTISAIVILIILTVSLCSCAPKRISKEPANGVLETVANSDSIAGGLVCVFAPDVCVKRKELGETEDAK